MATKVNYVKKNPNQVELGVLNRGDKFVRVCSKGKEPGVYIRVMSKGSFSNCLSINGMSDNHIYCVSLRSGCSVAFPTNELVIPVDVNMDIIIPS